MDKKLVDEFFKVFTPPFKSNETGLCVDAQDRSIQGSSGKSISYVLSKALNDFVE